MQRTFAGRFRIARILSLVGLSIFGLGASLAPSGAVEPLRVGHFPNVTHVQALVAHHFSRTGKGWFEERLGVPVEWFVYNAGPSAMEAIFARSIDLTYVGPSPALNAYVKSEGTEARIVAGAVNGGSALVVHRDSNIHAAADFRGRVLATPQLGNTQDVAARAWLAAGGLKFTLGGGEVRILPTANPDQLQLFVQKKLDGVWTVEPWVSGLEAEAGGKALVEEPNAPTTVLVVRAAFLKDRRELVRKFVNAHAELTDWIVKNPTQAQEIVRKELSEEVRAQISPLLVASAWRRMTLTVHADLGELKSFVANAQKAGLMKTVPDLGRLIEAP